MIIRPEVSKKNKYYISKYRYYELKYFCLQYPEWKRRVQELREQMQSASLIFQKKQNAQSDIVSKNAIEIFSLERNISRIVAASKEADEYLWEYILLAVTEGVSYTYLKTALGMPCSKGMYYRRYRKFFKVLGTVGT